MTTGNRVWEMGMTPTRRGSQSKAPFQSGSHCEHLLLGSVGASEEPYKMSLRIGCPGIKSEGRLFPWIPVPRGQIQVVCMTEGQVVLWNPLPPHQCILKASIAGSQPRVRARRCQVAPTQGQQKSVQDWAPVATFEMRWSQEDPNGTQKAPRQL